eukprot:scaffold14691_cov152-Skeletonema_dohrnii-CCMP3373.AAC.1
MAAQRADGEGRHDCLLLLKKVVDDGFGLNTKNRQLQLLKTSTSSSTDSCPQRAQHHSISAVELLLVWTGHGKIFPRPYASIT